MTNDQTNLDICLNHVITSALLFQPKDDKSWLWTARDFSDGEGKVETFVIRFPDAETSEAFMTFVREIQVITFCFSSQVPIYTNFFFFFFFFLQNGETESNGDKSKGWFT